MNPSRDQSALDADAEALYDALSYLVRVYQFRDRDRICCYDISITQCYALEALVRRGSLRLQVLADELFLDKSTTSRVVEALVQKEYVRRVDEPADRRAVQIDITAAGRRLYRRIRADIVSREKSLLAGLSAEVRAGAIELLRGLARAAAAQGDGPSCCGPAKDGE